MFLSPILFLSACLSVCLPLCGGGGSVSLSVYVCPTVCLSLSVSVLCVCLTLSLSQDLKASPCSISLCCVVCLWFHDADVCIFDSSCTAVVGDTWFFICVFPSQSLKLLLMLNMCLCFHLSYTLYWFSKVLIWGCSLHCCHICCLNYLMENRAGQWVMSCVVL